MTNELLTIITLHPLFLDVWTTWTSSVYYVTCTVIGGAVMDVYRNYLFKEREKRVTSSFCFGCPYSSGGQGNWCEKMVAEVKGVYIEDLAYLGCPRAKVERKTFHNEKSRR